MGTQGGGWLRNKPWGRGHGTGNLEGRQRILFVVVLLQVEEGRSKGRRYGLDESE